MKLERRKYQAEDSKVIVPRPIFLESALASIEGLVDRDGSFVETILADGVPICICGMVIQWRGVATFWTVSSKEIKVYPKAFHALILEMLEEYTRIFKIWRAQFNVRCEYTEGQKWASALGFTQEGRMYKFDPEKRDYFRYVRFFEYV